MGSRPHFPICPYNKRDMIRKLTMSAALTAGLLLAANAKIDEAKAKLKAQKYGEAITLLRAEHEKNPKDKQVTEALSEAHTVYGESVMNNAAMPPFRKYPAALKEFRTALELDKENKKARENIDLIESIYKSMGRPVPK